MPNLNQLNAIGSGAYFPIQITTAVDENGNPQTVTLPDGRVVEKKGWYMKQGSVDLIKHNLTSILTYQIGQRLREENFGVRTWECIEEPNTSALQLMIQQFVKDGIASWEPRIVALKIITRRPTREGIYMAIFFRVQDSTSVEQLNFRYNPNNLTTDAY